MANYHNTNDKASLKRSIFHRSPLNEDRETIHPEEPLGHLHQNFRHWAWLKPPSSFDARR